MNPDVPTREVREGRASLLVPDVPHGRGPGRRTGLPFYNPAMAVSRDLTVLALSATLPAGATVLDGLAATGVLGIRTLLETERDVAVTWNDKNPRAAEFVKRNAERNGVAGEIVREDLRSLLARQQFTYVDIDPFGTPVPFVDAAIQQTWRGSILGITATDTAPLAGTYPRTCWRRYGAKSLRNPCGPEVALRIFLGYLVRAAAAHERGVRPLLAFTHGHFLRAIIAVEPRARAADDALALLGYVRFEGARFEMLREPPTGPHAGPLWLGPLADSAVLAGVPRRIETGHASSVLLRRLAGEAELPPLFYENHAMAQTLGVNPVRVEAWVKALRTQGFRATRPHVTSNGVKTDAPWDVASSAYRALEPD